MYRTLFIHHLCLNCFGSCLQGFRKIDTDRWEFANEAFQRGKRHLLKNIQRRKTAQSQQVGSYIGPSSEAVSSGTISDIERLRKERSMLMQEVVELQQQHRGTASHVDVVNQRIQAAEQRQKQMVSFFAKLVQNPSFLARLRDKREQGSIDSSRTKRKFIKHQPSEQAHPDSPMEGQIVKFNPDWAIPYQDAGLSPFPFEQSPDCLPEGMVGMGSTSEGMPFEVGEIATDEFAVSNEFALAQDFIKAREQLGEGSSSLGGKNPPSKGKNIVSPLSPDYFSFPEDLIHEEKNISAFPSTGTESFIKEEDIWSMGFDASAGMSSSSQEFLCNVAPCQVPEFGISGGLSDMWDINSLQAAGVSGFDMWLADEPSVDDPESEVGQPNEDRSKKTDP